ncbi:hypothetical protein THRCLA_11073 [Thraustotheca clavata]|uniref:Uncharacterized protein n=1 Tax=Thraustotheca clavata TaxID=74557 RepID=A0A1V9Y947_9STRA|nr:hypothetical protein THRCLA_11073 [Thraustotheca clavata]
MDEHIEVPTARKEQVSRATTASTKQSKPHSSPAMSESILGTPAGSPMDIDLYVLPKASVAVLHDMQFVRMIAQYQDGIEGKLHEIVLHWQKLRDENDRAKFIFRSFDVPHCGLARVRLLYMYRKYVFTPELGNLIASLGCLAIVEYLHAKEPQENSIIFTANTMDHAATSGKLALVEFLDTQRTEGCTTRAMDNAAMNGHLDIVEYLHLHRSEGCTVEAMNGACRKGYLDVVKFLHKNRTEGCDLNAGDNAALNGHLDVMQFLCQNRRDDVVSDSALSAAIEKGHVEIVKLLLETYPMEGNTLKMLCDASRRGHLPIIKYLYNTRAEATRYTSQAIFYANQKGHSGLVAYLEAEQRHLVSQLA